MRKTDIPVDRFAADNWDGACARACKGAAVARKSRSVDSVAVDGRACVEVDVPWRSERLKHHNLFSTYSWVAE